jgi:hypothetical protein
MKAMPNNGSDSEAPLRCMESCLEATRAFGPRNQYAKAILINEILFL